MFAATILVGVLCADPAQFLKASLAATAPLQRPPAAIVNVYEGGSASLLEESADPRTDRYTQAPLVRMKLQQGAAFLSEHGDDVASLAADLAGPNAEAALQRLNELPASTIGSVMPALRALLADQKAGERVRQLAGSLAARLTNMPVASSQMDSSTGSNGNVYVTMPSPSRVYGQAASFLDAADSSSATAHVPNEVNVVYGAPASSFLEREASVAGDAVNVHVQTLSEPLKPFLHHLADLTTAAERATATGLLQAKAGPGTVNVHIPDSPRDGLAADIASLRSRIGALEARA